MAIACCQRFGSFALLLVRRLFAACVSTCEMPAASSSWLTFQQTCRQHSKQQCEANVQILSGMRSRSLCCQHHLIAHACNNYSELLRHPMKRAWPCIATLGVAGELYAVCSKLCLRTEPSYFVKASDLRRSCTVYGSDYTIEIAFVSCICQLSAGARKLLNQCRGASRLLICVAFPNAARSPRPFGS